VRLIREEFRKAYKLGDELLRRAQGVDDPAPLMYAQYALGTSGLYRSEWYLE
jgi:hypothetical protein